jgi:hypothetical protein
MKKRKFICLTASLFLILGGTAQAQSNDELKQKIYSIKRDQGYFYADVTSESRQQAQSDAEAYLFDQINNQASRQQKKPADGQTIKGKMGHVAMPRGNMYRAFVYVKKSDAIPGSVAAPAAVSTQQPAAPANSHHAIVVQRLLKLTKGTELQDCLIELKQQGHIESYNTYRNIGDPSKYILVVYNREGNIEALLSEGPNRTNLRTGKSDDVSNYSGRGAMGVKVKK